MTELAVFPIPGSVAFPGTELPLHVFEPRYRQMIHHCLDQQMPLAVCHTEKVLHAVSPMQTMSEALQHNQDTYKPVDVCSAGQVDLLKTLHDGRLFINVLLNQRYQLQEAIQTLPFMIYRAETLPDFEITPEQQIELEQLQDKILHRLLALSTDQPDVQSLLRSSQWQHKPAQQFSFELFGLLHMDPQFKQELLNNRSAIERLQLALDMLNQRPTLSG